jgi:NADPH:quinone reductase-like Zn-dependent oxidoreductase
MPNAVVMTGYGPPDVLTWTQVPRPEPGAGQIRIKVKAAGISPTDLALRAHRSMPMRQAAEAHRQLESGTVHERIILTLP